MNPDVKLFRKEKGDIVEYTPELTEAQMYLWDLYRLHMAEAVKLADGCPIFPILNGDPTQGAKYASETVSYSMSAQMLIAFANIRPLLQLPNVTKFRIASSTGSHVFEFGSADILLVNHLRTEFPQVDTKAVYHGLMRVNGATVDFAHHGPSPGIREWTKGNVARLYLQSLMFREIINDCTPPELVVRSHYHECVRLMWEVGKYRSWLVITPSYQVMGDHSHQITRSLEREEHGMVAVEIENSRIVEVHKLTKILDMRHREEIIL